MLEFLLRVLSSGLRFAQLNADLHALYQDAKERAQARERVRARARVHARADADAAAERAASNARAVFFEEGVSELDPEDEEDAEAAAVEAADRARERAEDLGE